MARYELSNEAARDLDRLYEFGALTFGWSQTDSYYDGLLDRLEQIALTPERYPAVDYIQKGYRRSVFGVHAIYYREHDDNVLIVRILGRQDIVTAMERT